MAICRECGSELKEGAQFCNKCGSKVNEQEEIPEEVVENRTENEYVVKYLMTYDHILKRNRYSKSKLIGTLIFAWFLLSGLISLIGSLFSLGGIIIFIVALIIGIVAYLICSFIGDFIRNK